jgi:hypothetical protein
MSEKDDLRRWFKGLKRTEPKGLYQGPVPGAVTEGLYVGPAPSSSANSCPTCGKPW